MESENIAKTEDAVTEMKLQSTADRDRDQNRTVQSGEMKEAAQDPEEGAELQCTCREEGTGEQAAKSGEVRKEQNPDREDAVSLQDTGQGEIPGEQNTDPEHAAECPDPCRRKEPEEKREEETAEGLPMGRDFLEKLLKKIEEEQIRIKESQSRLERKFDTEILDARNRDSQTLKLYKELQDYKGGLVEKYAGSILYDIVDLRESIRKQARRLTDCGEENISLEEFLEYGEDMASILEKYGVTIYHGRPDVPIDALRQKIVRKTETDDASRAKTVECCLSDGYEYNGKVLYPEKISVYVQKASDKG